MAGSTAAALIAPTTPLANVGRYLGLGSASLMGLGLVLAIVSRAVVPRADGQPGALAGLAFLIAIFAVCAGGIALLMGLAALIRPATGQTVNGRQHAILATTSGLASLFFCCAIGLIGASTS